MNISYRNLITLILISQITSLGLLLLGLTPLLAGILGGCLAAIFGPEAITVKK